MKKFLITLFVFLFPLFSYAGSEPGLMLFEVDGKVYYIKDMNLLEKLIGSSSCITDESNGDILELYKILYNACKDGFEDMVNRTVFSENSVINKGIKASKKLDSFLRNLSERMVYSNKIDIMDYSAKKQVMKKALEGCIVEKDMLTKSMTKQSHKSKFKITADIDNCIKQIHIDPRVASGDVCPLAPTVSDIKYIESLLDLNNSYRLKEFSFPVDGVFNQNKVIVFNGNVLVACENGNPVHLVKPTYSGREACQNGQYQSIPGFGGTPNGIYVVDKIIPVPEDEQVSWGGHKVPLIPATETNTFGRTNMYIHGTTDPNKHRSGGCISLGIAVDKFIDTGFIQGVVPVIVNTGVVYQDWK